MTRWGSRKRRGLALALLVVLPAVPAGAAPAPAPAPALTHGPLLGYVTAEAAVVWVRTNAPAAVSAEFAPNADLDEPLTTAPVSTESASDFTAQLALTGLPAATTVSYRVLLDGNAVTPIKRFRTAPAIGTPATVRLSVFADWDGGMPFPGLGTALARGTDDLFFIGDFDHSNPVTLGNMRRMHRNLRSSERAVGRDLKAKLIDVTDQVPLVNVWDDHDMRGDDCSKVCKNIPQARQAFREYWPMPTDAGPGTAIYQKLSLSGVDVFVLDLRSERDWKKATDNAAKSMLGVDQKQWFKNELQASTATWKVVMSSVPFNPTSKNFDSWQGYQTERTELLNFIATNHISGVLIASGDMHTGGGIDDGTNSSLPEANCPKANKIFSNTGKMGTWSHGIDRGGIGAGFCELVLTPTSSTMSIIGEDGNVRRSLTIPAPS